MRFPKSLFYAALPTLFLSAPPAHATTVMINPGSTATHVFGTWHQFVNSSWDAMLGLPDGSMQFDMRSEIGPLLDPTVHGIWRSVTVGIGFGGVPFQVFENWYDNLGDDYQTHTAFRANGDRVDYVFTGTYFPDINEWDGTFDIAVTAAVPEFGGTFEMLAGAFVGALMLRRRC